MKKIAILVPGGVGNADAGKDLPPLTALIRQLSETFDITVYSFTRIDGSRNQYQQQKIKTRFVDAEHGDSIVRRIVFIIYILVKDHLSHKYDSFHGMWAFPAGFVAVLLAKIFRVPSVVTILGAEAAYVPQIAYGNMINPVLKMITLWTCRNADVMAALTKYQRDKLNKFGLKRRQINIIPFGADQNKFKPSRKKPGSPIQCLHVASLTEVKDQRTLLKAFALIIRHRAGRLCLVGPDYMNGKLQQFAVELGILDHIEFVGQIRHDRLPEYYAKSDIMLHTSHYEGQGVVIAEAAASGVVICGTKVGLISDLGEDCTVSVDVGEHQQLADKVLELLQDERRFERLRDNAMKWANKHDADWTTMQYVRLYAKLLE